MNKNYLIIPLRFFTQDSLYFIISPLLTKVSRGSTDCVIVLVLFIKQFLVYFNS